MAEFQIKVMPPAPTAENNDIQKFGNFVGVL